MFNKGSSIIVSKPFVLDLTEQHWKDLTSLAEEHDIKKIIDQAIAIFYTALKFAMRGYRLALVPVIADSEVIDSQRPVRFVNITHL